MWCCVADFRQDGHESYYNDCDHCGKDLLLILLVDLELT